MQTTPNPDPALLPIPTPFQPPNGSKLKWRKYIPSGTGPFPTVLVVHGQGFHGGSPMDAGVEQVSRDLQARGYLALAVTVSSGALWPNRRSTSARHSPGVRPPVGTDR